ncbi:DNA ligase (plasmid) [Rhodococcus oxybenzonivorans]|uniref:DNA ligase (ATP) n=1 Tax=Rhodococcus oxybenzonivorans TaxID=1990687 RepID=A0A2S2C5H9_9NOCA|nr:non-homologous end-joining DNA ligase [Rhodococcus oxybenzonivorans]AWK76038.1 DNA ligase [Rhodococcus oxybenzonivorans]
MLATLGTLPAGESSGSWAAEIKYDGCRLLASAGGRSDPVLWSRNLNVVTSSYPELVEALADAFGGGRRVVLDGEVVALGADGRPSFGRLQRRMHVARPSTVLRRQVTVNFFAFDLLVLNGKDVMSVPYLDRRSALAELVPSHGAGLPVQAPPHWLGLSADTMLGVARETGMEGVVFKKVSSIYLPGRRTRSWVKTLVRQRMSAIVIGWVAGGGAQRNVVGSLILGAYDTEGVLRHIGHVGTGFTASMRRQLRDQLGKLERPTSPLPASSTHGDAPRGVSWVEPRVVVDVEFREFSESGGLRHSSFKGQRSDIPPEDATLPEQR